MRGPHISAEQGPIGFKSGPADRVEMLQYVLPIISTSTRDSNSIRNSDLYAVKTRSMRENIQE